MPVKSPVPTGKYAVGTMTYTVYGERSVASRLYYPTQKGIVKGLQKPRYMSREMAKGLSNSMMMSFNYEKNEKNGVNVSECYVNAPRIEGEKFPLIVFSHGYGEYRESNSFMCIELASQGYVVLCVSHSNQAGCTEFDDGTFVYGDKDLLLKTYKPYFGGARAVLKITKMKGTDRELAAKFDEFQVKYCEYLNGLIDVWIEDTQRAVEYARENMSDMIDFEKGIGATGHSFGGIVAYALCQNDPQFTCGINIDGIAIGNYEGMILRKPFMQISCAINRKLVTRVYLDHTEPVYRVVFRDMKHLGFSDLKYKLDTKKMVGSLDPDKMHENLCMCHLDFFDAYLKKLKKAPEISTNDVIKVEIKKPDI